MNRDWRDASTLTNLSGDEALQILAQIEAATRIPTRDEQLAHAQLIESRRVNDAAIAAAAYHETASVEAQQFAKIANGVGDRLRRAHRTVVPCSSRSSVITLRLWALRSKNRFSQEVFLWRGK